MNDYRSVQRRLTLQFEAELAEVRAIAAESERAAIVRFLRLKERGTMGPIFADRIERGEHVGSMHGTETGNP